MRSSRMLREGARREIVRGILGHVHIHVTQNVHVAIQAKSTSFGPNHDAVRPQQIPCRQAPQRFCARGCALLLPDAV